MNQERFRESGATESRRVEVSTVGDFAANRLGTDPLPGLSALDWLTLTGQAVLEVTAGPVFTDQTSELTRVRQVLRWYPPDVERYVRTLLTTLLQEMS